MLLDLAIKNQLAIIKTTFWRSQGWCFDSQASL